jgi:hypothetical protein
LQSFKPHTGCILNPPFDFLFQKDQSPAHLSMGYGSPHNQVSYRPWRSVQKICHFFYVHHFHSLSLHSLLLEQLSSLTFQLPGPHPFFAVTQFTPTTDNPADKAFIHTDGLGKIRLTAK